MALCRRRLVIVIRICLLVVMITESIKFLHLLCVLGLLGLTVHCVTSKGTLQYLRIQTSLLILALLGVITGTLLVHPRHFTFHTHWIIAAYVLMISFIVSISLLFFYKKNSRWIYLLLSILLVIVIHDAVTKSTFF